VATSLVVVAVVGALAAAIGLGCTIAYAIDLYREWLERARASRSPRAAASRIFAASRRSRVFQLGRSRGSRSRDKFTNPCPPKREPHGALRRIYSSPPRAAHDSEGVPISTVPVQRVVCK